MPVTVCAGDFVGLPLAACLASTEARRKRRPYRMDGVEVMARPVTGLIRNAYRYRPAGMRNSGCGRAFSDQLSSPPTPDWR